MKNQFPEKFEKIISVENILEAWKEFERGKKNRKDVQEFSLNLMDILKKYISDENTLWIIGEIVRSFESNNDVKSFLDSRFRGNDKIIDGDDKRGLPLGNLTSQLFVNIYMNEFDQFVKRRLKAKYYIRYSDDFVIFSENKEWLENIVSPIKIFLKEKIRLELHPSKVFLKTLASGMDFLGMVNFPGHRILRTKTKKRILRNIEQKRFLSREELIFEESFNQSLRSCLGILKHCRGYKIAVKIGEIEPGCCLQGNRL